MDREWCVRRFRMSKNTLCNGCQRQRQSNLHHLSWCQRQQWNNLPRVYWCRRQRQSNLHCFYSLTCSSTIGKYNSPANSSHLRSFCVQPNTYWIMNPMQATCIAFPNQGFRLTPWQRQNQLKWQETLALANNAPVLLQDWQAEHGTVLQGVQRARQYGENIGVLEQRWHDRHYVLCAVCVLRRVAEALEYAPRPCNCIPLGNAGGCSWGQNSRQRPWPCDVPGRQASVCNQILNVSVPMGPRQGIHVDAAVEHHLSEEHSSELLAVQVDNRVQVGLQQHHRVLPLAGSWDAQVHRWQVDGLDAVQVRDGSYQRVSCQISAYIHVWWSVGGDELPQQTRWKRECNSRQANLTQHPCCSNSHRLCRLFHQPGQQRRHLQSTMDKNNCAYCKAPPSVTSPHCGRKHPTCPPGPFKNPKMGRVEQWKCSGARRGNKNQRKGSYVKCNRMARIQRMNEWMKPFEPGSSLRMAHVQRRGLTLETRAIKVPRVSRVQNRSYIRRVLGINFQIVDNFW